MKSVKFEFLRFNPIILLLSICVNFIACEKDTLEASGKMDTNLSIDGSWSLYKIKNIVLNSNKDIVFQDSTLANRIPLSEMIMLDKEHIIIENQPFNYQISLENGNQFIIYNVFGQIRKLKFVRIDGKTISLYYNDSSLNNRITVFFLNVV